VLYSQGRFAIAIINNTANVMATNLGDERDKKEKVVCWKSS